MTVTSPWMNCTPSLRWRRRPSDDVSVAALRHTGHGRRQAVSAPLFYQVTSLQ